MKLEQYVIGTITSYDQIFNRAKQSNYIQVRPHMKWTLGISMYTLYIIRSIGIGRGGGGIISGGRLIRVVMRMIWRWRLVILYM